MTEPIKSTIRSHCVGTTAVVYASDYLNKLTGEKIERECKKQLDSGARALVIDFSDTELVNSIGISILLGIIDVAEKRALVVFSDEQQTVQLFDARPDPPRRACRKRAGSPLQSSPDSTAKSGDGTLIIKMDLDFGLGSLTLCLGTLYFVLRIQAFNRTSKAKVQKLSSKTKDPRPKTTICKMESNTQKLIHSFGALADPGRRLPTAATYRDGAHVFHLLLGTLAIRRGAILECPAHLS